MKLEEILKQAGRNKKAKRIGRGTGSGCGKTSGRGHKGAGARSGYKRKYGKEGGQNPLLAKIPQRGFSNFRFQTEYQLVNIAAMECFENGTRVDAAALKKANLISDEKKPVKILGDGELTKKLTVVAAKFSKAAAEKISQAGGQVEQV